MLAGVLIATQDEKVLSYDESSKSLRITFEYFDIFSNGLKSVAAVPCKDLYADHIAMEKNGTASTSFSSMWYSGPGTPWICPNLTQFDARVS